MQALFQNIMRMGPFNCQEYLVLISNFVQGVVMMVRAAGSGAELKSDQPSLLDDVLVVPDPDRMISRNILCALAAAFTFLHRQAMWCQQ